MAALLDQFGKPISSTRRESRAIRARYDVAQTTPNNSRHWAAADALSPNAANGVGVRATIRNRARYEVANNSYARGIVNSMAFDLIGTGPRLQLQTNNREANAKVERAFAAWFREIRAAEKCITATVAKITDGETFGILTTNPRIRHPVKLDIRLIECDQCTSSSYSYLTEPNAVDGIKFDAYGNPDTYSILKRHPGDLMGVSPANPLDYDLLDASSVIHWYRVDRPGQARGISELVPALPLFAQLRRFTAAELTAAEVAADIAAVIYTDTPPQDGSGPGYIDPWSTIEIERGAMLTLPDMWKVAQVKAEHPTTTYAMFKREIINEIARCLIMPYNIAAASSAGYNYASGRLDHQTYDIALRVIRSHFEIDVLDRIFFAWLDEAMFIPGLLPVGLEAFYDMPHQWFWDSRPHVDPVKEAVALGHDLRNGMTSFPEAYSRKGQDYEVEQERAAQSLGITVDEYRALLRQSLFGPASREAATVVERDDADESEGE